MTPQSRLPAVHRVARSESLAAFPPAAVVAAARTVLDRARHRLAADPAEPVGLDSIVAATLDQLTTPLGTLRPVLNATGIVLHTNLGRAPVSESVAARVAEVARSYTDLELDLATGKRASRSRLVRSALAELCHAEAATVVNNCAATTVLTLRALAAGKEVIVSRGQLVEIGGSYRLPEILAASGARLREVGTTNITRAADYESAITAETGLILRVHPSNYRVEGFTKSVPLAELVRIGRAKNVPVVDDAGSGCVDSLPALRHEPNVAESVPAGADLVLFSGDKLLGGPQAGIAAGRKSLVAKLERDPLARAFRCDKLTLAALSATLDERARGHRSPVRQMLGQSIAELTTRSEPLRAALTEAGWHAELVPTQGYVGGGSAPGKTLPSVAVSVTSPRHTAEELAAALRQSRPAVVARIERGRVLLDLRTIFPRDDETLTRLLTGLA